jgi:hypothetical protein
MDIDTPRCKKLKTVQTESRELSHQSARKAHKAPKECLMLAPSEIPSEPGAIEARSLPFRGSSMRNFESQHFAVVAANKILRDIPTCSETAKRAGPRGGRRCRVDKAFPESLLSS